MEQRHTRVYEVVAKEGKVVFGHVQGERFTASLTEGEETALLRGGFLAVVVDEPRRRAPRRQPEVSAPEAPDEQTPDDPGTDDEQEV